MTLILMATALAGVLASKGLLVVGLHNVALRYPVTVLFAYLVFFVAIKIWLRFMTEAPRPDRGLDLLDGVDIPLSSWGGGTGSSSFAGGGGASGGAGASGDFGAVLENAEDTGGGPGEAVGEVIGAAADDEGGLVLVVVLGLLAALLFAVLGAGTFLIWHAPSILAEAAFDTVLAASLTRSAKRMNQPDWQGSVLRATWKPFATVLAFALLAGWAMHSFLPQASSIRDVLRMIG